MYVNGSGFRAIEKSENGTPYNIIIGLNDGKSFAMLRIIMN